MIKHLIFTILILQASHLIIYGQCPDNVNLSANAKCIQVSWNTTPSPLPSINNYTYSSGTNPAIYFETSRGNSGCNNYNTPFTGSLVVGGVTCNYTSGLLPVAFSSISVQFVSRGAQISFSTTSETNNDYFTIERSADGRSFESIGEIKGAGDSRKERHYSFTDVKPLSGINYYRIKQTDFDGKYSYSEIKSVRFSSALPFDITPRQTEGSLLVATEIENYSVQVLGSDGRLLLSLANLSASQHIDLNAFKPGIYYIRLIHEGVSETKRIVRI